MRRNKGITLIALVITIIVLLILAGVAIAMLSGQNGILRKATEAKTKTEQAQEEEQTKLAQMEAASNLNGTTHTEKVASIGNKEISVKIPAGFSISPREGEQKIETGMVIIDQEGNEYVWIPVFEKDENCTWGVDYSTVKTKAEDSDGYYTAIQTALKTYTATYKQNGYGYVDAWYGNSSYGQYGYYDGTKFIYYTNGNMTEEEYNKLYRGMLKSVYENGGFYIGRYEMGIAVVNSIAEAQQKTRIKMEEYTASTATNTSTTTVAKGAPSIEGMAIPVSKANAVPYNYITQSQAQMLAEKLGKKSSYSQVTSSIMFGVQWDAVCVFIEKCDKNNTVASNWLKSDSYCNLWGNFRNAEFKLDRGFYTTSYDKDQVTWTEDYVTKKGTTTEWLCTTGASEQNKSLNIYDFGGNEAEWTLERFNRVDSPCVDRGFGFSVKNYVSYRNVVYIYRSNFYTSSRVALYIK